jgi:hypothetical protein
MPRYRFDLHECGSVVADEEGRELPDIAAARVRATMEAREIMAAEVKQGRLCLSCHIEIMDEAGRPASKILFREALYISGLG